MSRSVGMDNMGYGSSSRMMANDPRYFQTNQFGRGDSNINTYSQQAVQSYSRQGMTQGQKGNEFGNNNDSTKSGKIASAITSGSGEKIQKELSYEENCMIVSECIEFLNDEIEGYKEQIENKKNRIQQLKLQNYLTLEKLIKMKEKRRTLKLKLKMKNKLNMDVKKNKTKKRKS
ncbi:hypothetical protein K502DRAFT_299358 [Neoconidiobolus thromboides FSU 785]|nr:hypothetical protein K502DRAFT_299358 [Neoconidiobolus thromboides FSU 785]